MTRISYKKTSQGMLVNKLDIMNIDSTFNIDINPKTFEARIFNQEGNEIFNKICKNLAESKKEVKKALMYLGVTFTSEIRNKQIIDISKGKE